MSERPTAQFFYGPLPPPPDGKEAVFFSPPWWKGGKSFFFFFWGPTYFSGSRGALAYPRARRSCASFPSHAQLSPLFSRANWGSSEYDSAPPTEEETARDSPRRIRFILPPLRRAFGEGGESRKFFYPTLSSPFPSDRARRWG